MSNLIGFLPSAIQAFLKSYVVIIFAGGLIFFLINTPGENLQAVIDAILSGDINASITAVVDACVAFAENVRGLFDGDTLSGTVQTSLCKIMEFVAGKKGC